MDTWELEVWFEGDEEKSERIERKVREALADEEGITIKNGTWT